MVAVQPALLIRMSMWGPKAERVVEMISAAALGRRRSQRMEMAEGVCGREVMRVMRAATRGALLGELYVITT